MGNSPSQPSLLPQSTKDQGGHAVITPPAHALVRDKPSIDPIEAFLHPTHSTTLIAPLPAVPQRPPPRTPLPWLWRCHHCRTVYRLACTRRCLECSHQFCTAVTSPSPLAPRPSSARRRQQSRRPGTCRAEFDYNGWETYGGWRRDVLAAQGRAHTPPHMRKVAALVGESSKTALFVARRHDCFVHCDYPSECHHEAYRATGQHPGQTTSSAHQHSTLVVDTTAAHTTGDIAGDSARAQDTADKGLVSEQQGAPLPTAADTGDLADQPRTREDDDFGSSDHVAYAANQLDLATGVFDVMAPEPSVAALDSSSSGDPPESESESESDDDDDEERLADLLATQHMRRSLRKLAQLTGLELASPAPPPTHQRSSSRRSSTRRMHRESFLFRDDDGDFAFTLLDGDLVSPSAASFALPLHGTEDSAEPFVGSVETSVETFVEETAPAPPVVYDDDDDAEACWDDYWALDDAAPSGSADALDAMLHLMLAAQPGDEVRWVDWDEAAVSAPSENMLSEQRLSQHRAAAHSPSSSVSSTTSRSTARSSAASSASSAAAGELEARPSSLMADKDFLELLRLRNAFLARE